MPASSRPHAPSLARPCAGPNVRERRKVRTYRGCVAAAPPPPFRRTRPNRVESGTGRPAAAGPPLRHRGRAAPSRVSRSGPGGARGAGFTVARLPAALVSWAQSRGEKKMARGAALMWSAALAALAAASARADIAVSVNDGHTVITPAGPASSPTPRPDTLSVIDLSADPP